MGFQPGFLLDPVLLWSDTTYFKGGDEFLLRLLFLINSILWSPDLSPIIGKTKFSAKFFLYVYWGTAFLGLGVAHSTPELGSSGFILFPSVWPLSRLGFLSQNSAFFSFLVLFRGKCHSKSTFNKS